MNENKADTYGVLARIRDVGAVLKAIPDSRTRVRWLLGLAAGLAGYRRWKIHPNGIPVLRNMPRAELLEAERCDRWVRRRFRKLRPYAFEQALAERYVTDAREMERRQDFESAADFLIKASVLLGKWEMSGQSAPDLSRIMENDPNLAEASYRFRSSDGSPRTVVSSGQAVPTRRTEGQTGDL